MLTLMSEQNNSLNLDSIYAFLIWSSVEFPIAVHIFVNFTSFEFKFPNLLQKLSLSITGSAWAKYFPRTPAGQSYVTDLAFLFSWPFVNGRNSKVSASPGNRYLMLTWHWLNSVDSTVSCSSGWLLSLLTLLHCPRTWLMRMHSWSLVRGLQKESVIFWVFSSHSRKIGRILMWLSEAPGFSFIPVFSFWF